MFTRRRFLAGAIPCLALITGGISVASYEQGGCPLSSSGLCVGPCSALVDRDGDLFCDRIGAPVQPAPAASEPISSQVLEPAQAEPEAPKSGQAQPAVPKPADVQPKAPQAKPSAQPTAQPRLARPTSAPRVELVVPCPFGLVNDPYPGRCRRYVDRNGNGICDLSEPRPVGQANP